MPKLDDFTQKHLDAWLSDYERPGDRRLIRARIMTALRAYPDAVARGRSWPELHDLGKELRHMESERIANAIDTGEPGTIDNSMCY